MSPTKSDSSVEAQPRSGISLKEDEELPGTKTSSASSTDDSEVCKSYIWASIALAVIFGF